MTTTDATAPAAAASPAHPAGGAHHSRLSPWWRLVSLLWPEGRDMGTIVVYGIAGAVLTLAVPLTVDALISNITFGTLLTPLIVLVGILLGCLALQAVLRAMQAWVVELIERRIFLRVAGDLAFRLPRVDISAFDQRHGPELVNRFFDTVTLQKTGKKLLLAATDIVLQTGVGMVVLSFYHPFLFGFVIALIFGVAIIVIPLGVGGVRTAVRVSFAKYDVAAWLQELARQTTAFCTRGGAEFALARADELCGVYLEARRRHFRVLFRQVCGALLLQVAASTAVLGIGGWLVIDQQLTAGQLVASELIVSAVVGNIAKLGDLLPNWYDACAAADKLGHLIDLPLERQHGEPLPATRGGVAIEMAQVSSGLPESSSSLCEFTMSIRAGERVALVGSVGGSASHLLDVLFGLRLPAHGHVTVDGIDVRQLRLDAMRDEFSLVHGTEIVEGTVLENIQFGRKHLTASQVRDALEAVGIWHEILDLPQGLETPLATRGAPLDESQASRLMLARAIIGEPRLLLLDGALDALSPVARRRVLDHLFDKKHAWTLLVVTQMPDVVAACDRSIELERIGHGGRRSDPARPGGEG